MFSLSLFCLSIWLAVYFCSLLFPKSIRQKLPIAPSAEASFLWGHEYRVAKYEVGVEYLRWMQMLGPVYRIKAALFRKDILVISDSVAVRHVVNHVYTYGKSPVFSSIAYKALGRGLVWAEGDEHKTQRRLLAPAFTSSAVKAMIPNIQAIIERNMLRVMIDVEAQGPCATLNMVNYIGPCMFEIIGSVGFSHDLSYNTSESKAVLTFHRMWSHWY